MRIALLIALLAFVPSIANAAGGSDAHASAFPATFLFIVCLLVLGRIGAMTERFGQPAVLGELLMGVALGALALVPGLTGIESFRHDSFIAGIAEIGVILLLFKTGLESDLTEMRKIGVKAAAVAVVGVVLPFVGGYYATKLLVPDASFETALFLGATLTATSVGITARVFKDLGVLQTIEAKIVLGAAVIDDVLGLLILAVVAGIASGAGASAGAIAMLSLKAFGFLAAAVLLGQAFAPKIGKLFSMIHSGIGMKMALALLFCGAFAYGAHALAGLAPIVGAFAAGLVLDHVHFAEFAKPRLSAYLRDWAERLRQKDASIAEELEREANREEEGHVENLVDGVSNLFVPIFFVYTGLQVNLAVFADLGIVGIALIVTAIAFASKVVSGYAAGSGCDRKLIGFGMAPRGEVGLIFANVGKQIGVIDDRMFAITVIVVLLTTLLTPPTLGVLAKRPKAA